MVLWWIAPALATFVVLSIVVLSARSDCNFAAFVAVGVALLLAPVVAGTWAVFFILSHLQ